MKQYLDLLDYVLKHGNVKEDRTGTGTKSVFGWQMRFDLNKGFPLLTTKKLHLRSIIHELLWFIRGDTNISYLKDNNVSIWDEWADENGDLGPVYGKQWRRWITPEGRKLDQLHDVISEIKNNPNSRRMIVSADTIILLEFGLFLISLITSCNWSSFLPSGVIHLLHCLPYTGPRSPFSSAHSSHIDTLLSFK